MKSWRSIFRIIMKAVMLFVLLNGLFALLRPLPSLGSLSLYNSVWHGRERLPYGENPAESYNLSLNNIPAMFASHSLSTPKAEDEFRVVVIGDSGIWGWFLPNEETLTAQLNGMDLQTKDGRTLTFYNLGYPIMSVSKDLLILEEALQHEPDLIIWPLTLESLNPATQLEHPILQNNPERLRPLIQTYHLNLDPNDPRFVEPTFWQQSIMGQRRALADWLRLQQVGLAWSATHVDQTIPDDIPLRTSDFEEDVSWHNFPEPVTLSSKELAIDGLIAGTHLAADVPILFINEPIFISEGENSDLRYNLWYPRWAYDQYREVLADTAVAQNWLYFDAWDQIEPTEFTDSPVHLTPAGTTDFAALIASQLKDHLPIHE